MKTLSYTYLIDAAAFILYASYGLIPETAACLGVAPAWIMVSVPIMNKLSMFCVATSLIMKIKSFIINQPF